MYRLSLPTVCPPPEAAAINRRLLLATALSVLAHLLVYLIFLNHEEKQAPNASEKAGQGIEVMLTTLPKAKPAAPPPAPKPPRPAPVAKAKPAPSIKPALKPPQQKPQTKAEAAPVPTPEPLPPPVVTPTPVPEPKPKEAQEPQPTLVAAPPKPEPAPVEPAPEPEPQPEPTPKPRPAPKGKHKAQAETEAVPEFKDDFQQLSTTYGHDDPAAQAAASASVAKPDTGVHPGAILNINPRIYYPRDAMNKGMQGVVIVLIHISTDGHTDGVDLIQSSGYEELDNQVLGAVQHWRFTPPRRGSTPVEGTYKHTVIFGANQMVLNDFATHWREVKLMPAK